LQVPPPRYVGLPYASGSSVDASTIIALNVEQHYSEEDTFTLTRYRQFVRHLDRSAVDILDIGCNTGRGGAVLKSALPASRLVGVDCVPERVKGVDPAIYEKAICSFTTSIDLPNSSFHAIVAGEFIEHLPPMEVSPSLSEFFRLLRLNGQIVLTTPHPRFILRRFGVGSVLLDPAHLSQHTPRSLCRRLEDTGFTRIKVRGSGRVCRLVGEHFPVRAVYGSYLVKAVKL
jgi:SAM-dependent methyltransferase